MTRRGSEHAAMDVADRIRPRAEAALTEVRCASWVAHRACAWDRAGRGI